MAEGPVRRSLIAILAIDAVGYSRQMGRDATATLARLQTYRALIDAAVARHGGQVFGVAGDSEMAVLPAAPAALACALAIQQAIAEENAALPKDRQMPVRIGINYGTVLVEGDGVFGDDVNIAARVEALAGPGGICLSGAVFEQLDDTIACGYEAYGPQRLKNIAQRVRVYRVRTEPEMVGWVVPGKPPRPRKYWRAVAAAALVAVALAGLWNMVLRDEVGQWQATAAARQATAAAERLRGEQLLASLLAAEGRIEAERARGAELLAALRAAERTAAARLAAAAEAARRAAQRQAEEAARAAALLQSLQAAERRAAAERRRTEELLGSLQAMEQRAAAAQGERRAERAGARRQAAALLASWQATERQAAAERGRAQKLVAALQQAERRASADAAAHTARQAELARTAAAERARAEQVLAALRAAEQRASDELKSGAAYLAALGQTGDAGKRARAETLLVRLRSIDRTATAERLRAERVIASWGARGGGDAAGAAAAEPSTADRTAEPPHAARARAEALLARWRETERRAAAKRATAAALLTRLRQPEIQVPPRPQPKPAAFRSAKPTTTRPAPAPTDDASPPRSAAPIRAAGRLAAVGKIDGRIAAAALARAGTEPPPAGRAAAATAPDESAVYPKRASVGGRVRQPRGQRRAALVEPLSIAAVERQLRDRKAALHESLQAYIDQRPELFRMAQPRVTAIWGITVVSLQIDAFRVRVTFDADGSLYTNARFTYEWTLTLRLENDDIRIAGHTSAETRSTAAEPESTAAVERHLRDRKAALHESLQAYIDQRPELFRMAQPRVTAIWGAFRVRVT